MQQEFFNARIMIKYIIHAALIFFMLLSTAAAQEATQYSEDDLEVSYIYAAVLGTGTYKIRGRRLTMFRLPFKIESKLTEDMPGKLRWLLPVVIGYDDIGAVDSDIISALLPNNLVTLTFLPGIEYVYEPMSGWQLKPFIQLGAGRDFSSKETISMGHLGVRSLNLFRPANDWEIRWGNTLRWATEYQLESEDHLQLSIFETGLDIRRNLPLRLFEKRTDIGIYYIYQRLIPKWVSVSTPDYEAEAKSLNEFGLSVGLKSPRSFLGLEMKRLRIGYKTGGSIDGWTIGTIFPF